MEDLFTEAERTLIARHVLHGEWYQLGLVITTAALRPLPEWFRVEYMPVIETVVADAYLMLRAQQGAAGIVSLGQCEEVCRALQNKLLHLLNSLEAN